MLECYLGQPVYLKYKVDFKTLLLKQLYIFFMNYLFYVHGSQTYLCLSANRSLQ